MRALLTAAAILAAGQVQAATYSYQGLPFPCAEIGPCEEGETRTLSGSLTFGREFRNATLDLSAEYASHEPEGSNFYHLAYSISDATGTTSDAWTATGWSESFLLGVTGDLVDALYPIAYDGHVHLEFDAKGRVTFWHMNGINGGTRDWSSTIFGDGDGYGSNDTPGKWSVSEVPLPATLPLLAAAMIPLRRWRSSPASAKDRKLAVQ